MTWADLYPWIVGALGGMLGAAFLLPTKLGEALFSYRLGKALEGFKAEQNREIEKLKGEQSRALELLKEQLNHLGDRGRRSNELEFNAVTAVWAQFMEAFATTDAVVASFTQVPDLSQLNESNKLAYVNNSELSQIQKDQVLAASDPTDMMVKILNWRKIAATGEQLFLAHKVIRKERIFLPDAIRLDFMRMLDILAGAYVQRKMEHESPNRTFRLKGVETFYAEGQKGVDVLAEMVRAQLIRTS